MDRRAAIIAVPAGLAGCVAGASSKTPAAAHSQPNYLSMIESDVSSLKLDVSEIRQNVNRLAQVLGVDVFGAPGSGLLNDTVKARLVALDHQISSVESNLRDMESRLSREMQNLETKISTLSLRLATVEEWR